MAGQTFYRDKPYVFVPLVGQVSRRAADAMRGQVGRACGCLEITITAMSPVHFGQALVKTSFDKVDGTFVRVLPREGGRIVLPGAGLKGMLRAVFEAVTPSCVLFVPKKPDRMIDLLPAENQYACGTSRVCPACSVFGCLGVRGKLTFSPFVADEGARTEELCIPQMQTPFRDYPFEKKRGNERLYYGNFEDVHGADVGNMEKEEFLARKDRERLANMRAPSAGSANAGSAHIGSANGGSANVGPGNVRPANARPAYARRQFYGRKFYKHAAQPEVGNDEAGNTFECLKAGSVMRGTIGYQGLTQVELAMLLFALGVGWDKAIFHKVGYAKPAYFGSVQIGVELQAAKERYRNFPGGEGVGMETLRAAAVGYRRDARGDVLHAIKAIEHVWGALEGESQWRVSLENAHSRVY